MRQEPVIDHRLTSRITMRRSSREEITYQLPPADLPGEIELLREDLRTERDRHLRTLADLTNFRRRVEREAKTLAEEGKREVLLSLLGVVDDLENALRWSDHGGDALVQGISAIHQKLVAVLGVHDVRSFDAVGQPFTPDLHEAVAVQKRPMTEPGTVVEVLRKGYLWKDELFRAAQVQVAE